MTIEDNFIIVQEMKQTFALKCLKCHNTEKIYRLPVQQVNKIVYVCFNCNATYIADNEEVQKYEKEFMDKINPPKKEVEK